MTNPLSIEYLLFILFYMTTQDRLHTSSLLTVAIHRPSGYSCGDYDLTQGTIGLTYKYSLLCALFQAYAALNGHNLHLSFSSRYHLHAHALAFPSSHTSPFCLRWSFASFVTFLSFCRACDAPYFACTWLLPCAPFLGQHHPPLKLTPHSFVSCLALLSKISFSLLTYVLVHRQ